MPKERLDQSKPQKVSSAAMAHRKKAKMMKEKAKLEELRRQFPKLFSPEKVKSIEKRSKNLVQPSLKKSVCSPATPPPKKIILKRHENQENAPLNIQTKKPFSTVSTSHTPEKNVTSNSTRVLQVLGSASPAIVTRNDRSRGSVIHSCSCKNFQPDVHGPSEALDVENQQCDICAEIAPHANSRQNVVNALRNYLHRPPSDCEHDVEEKSKYKSVIEEETSVESVSNQFNNDNEKCQEEDLSLSTPEIYVPEQDSFPVNNLMQDLDMEMCTTENLVESEYEQEIKDEVIDDKVDNTFDAQVDDHASLETQRECFNETLNISLTNQRVRGRIVGRRVLDNYVEFIYKVQVLKEGFCFSDINDKEYLADCVSPSSSVTKVCDSKTAFPYVIQMCILRRYSDFEKLQEKLLLICKKSSIDCKELQEKFPPKQYFSMFGKRWADPAFLQSRQEGLVEWMNDCVLPMSALKNVTDYPKRIALRGKFVKAIHDFIAM